MRGGYDRERIVMITFNISYQVFVSHSKDDQRKSFFSDAFASSGVKAVYEEFETLVPADTEKIMASRLSISTGDSHDAIQFSKLITGTEERVCADKAHDSRNTFILLRENETQAIIPRGRTSG